MRLFLVRHGQTSENAANIVQGQRPGSLTDEGARQARAVAGKLGQEHFDAVYSSDLARAIQTARIVVNDRRDLEIITDKRLREQAFGVHEGSPIPMMLRQMKHDGADFRTFSPVGGENPSVFRRRVLAFYEDIRSCHKEQKVLLITHQGVINALLSALVYNQGEAPADLRIANGGITILRVDGSGRASIDAKG